MLAFPHLGFPLVASRMVAGPLGSRHEVSYAGRWFMHSGTADEIKAV